MERPKVTVPFPKVLHSSFTDLLQEIAPQIYQLTFHFPATTNCFFYKEDDGLTLIDAGNFWNTQVILNAIVSLGEPLKRIVITHAHPDHAGAAAEISRITSAPVYAQAEDIPYLEGRATMSDLPGDLACKLMLNALQRIGMLAAPKISSVHPLGDGEKLGSLEVIHTPGHTPGSISLWAGAQNALFCGDNISNIARLHLGLSIFTLNAKERNQSLKRYENLPGKILLAGHGPAYFSQNAIAELLGRVP